MRNRILVFLSVIAVMLFSLWPTFSVRADAVTDYIALHRNEIPHATGYSGADSYLYYTTYLAPGTTQGNWFTRRFNIQLSDGTTIPAVCAEAQKPSRPYNTGDAIATFVLHDNTAEIVNIYHRGAPVYVNPYQAFSRLMGKNGHSNVSPNQLYNMSRVLFAAGLSTNAPQYNMMYHYNTAPFVAWRSGSNDAWTSNFDYNRLVGHIAASMSFNTNDRSGLTNEGATRYGQFLISYAHTLNVNSYVLDASGSAGTSIDSVGLDEAYTTAMNDGNYYSEQFSYTGLSIVPIDAGVQIVGTPAASRFKVPQTMVSGDTFSTGAKIAGLSSGGSSSVVLNMLYVVIPPTPTDQIIMGVTSRTTTSPSEAAIVFAFSKSGSQPWSFTLSKVDAETGSYITTGQATVGFYTDAACTSPATVDYNGSNVSQAVLPKDSDATFTVNDPSIQVVYIKELSAPTGYAVSPDTYRARPGMSITIKDEVPLGRVTLEKKDAQTASTLTGNDFTLNGAAYDLIADSNITYPGRGTLFTAGQKVVTATVGKIYALNPITGAITVSDGSSGEILVTGLPLGSYHFEETTAPAGFELNSSDITFTISESTPNWSVEVEGGEEESRAPFRFRKVSVAPNTNVITEYSGRQFKIYRAQDIAAYLGLTYDSSVLGGGIDWNAQDLRSVDWSSTSLKPMQLINNVANTEHLVVPSYNAGQLKTTAGNTFTNGTYSDYIMTSGTDGYVLSEPLPIGQYIVREINCAEDYTEMKPFVVTISSHSGSPTTVLPEYDLGDKRNYPFAGRIHVSKIDSLTGKNIYVAGVGFQIFKSSDNGLTYSSTPLVLNGADTWYTDASGICYIGGPEYDLEYGYYMIKEVETTTPDNYVYDDGYYITVKIANESTIQYHYTNIDDYAGKAALRAYTSVTTLNYTTVYGDLDKPINTYSIKYDNIPDTGGFRITKNGEGALVSWTQAGGFVYSTQLFNGARYAIYAAEDIYTYDNYSVGGSRTVYYHAGDLVSYILQSSTDPDPEEYIETGYNYNLWYYDSANAGCTQPLFTVTAGTTGVTEITGLPLGHYVIKEVQAPEGHTLNTTEYDVILSRGDLDITTPNMTARTYTNERQKIALQLNKLVFSTVRMPIAGRKFDLYAAENIYGYNGSLVCSANSYIGSGTSDANGVVVFDNGDTLPFAKYYIVEELVSDIAPDVELTDPMELSKAASWLSVDLTSPSLSYTYNGNPRVVGSGGQDEPVLLADITWSAANQTSEYADYTSDVWNTVSALTVAKCDRFTGRTIAGARLTLTGPLNFIASDATAAAAMGFENATFSNTATTTTVTFTSTTSGALISSPVAGHYVLTEIAAPAGYEMATEAKFASSSFLPSGYTDISATNSIEFDVTTSTDGYYTVAMYDIPKTGRIEVSKLGLSVSGFTTSFLYTDQFLTGAEYTITAKNNIYSYDGSGQILYNAGDVVAVIKTGYGSNISWDDSGIQVIPIGHSAQTNYEPVAPGAGDYAEDPMNPGFFINVGAGNGDYIRVDYPAYIDTYIPWIDLISVDPADPNNVSNPYNSVGLTGSAMYIDGVGNVVGGTQITLGDEYVYNRLISQNPDYLTYGQIDNWQTYGSAYLKGIPFGTYVVTETKAPAGYVLDSTTNSAEFTISDTATVWNRSFSNQRVNFRLELNKYNYTMSYDSVGNTYNMPIEGVWFALYPAENICDSNGMVIWPEGVMLASASSDSNGHVAFPELNLPAGKYYIIEIGAVEYLGCDASLTNQEGNTVNAGANTGFVTDVTALNLPVGLLHTVDSDGNPVTVQKPVFEITLDSTGATPTQTTVTRTVDIFNKNYTVQIVKHAYNEWWAYLSGLTGEPAPLTGAVLKISHSSGTWSETWVTGSEPKTFVLPMTGDYTITEISAPAGFAPIDPYTFTIEAADLNGTKYINILDREDSIHPYISKIDIVTGNELPGAQLHIEDSAGNIIESWTSSDIPFEFIPPVDGEYTLVEDVAPAGYDIAAPIHFTISAGKVLNDPNNKIIMKDYPSTGLVEVSKVDITTDAELPGAQLRIIDGGGTVVDSWVSTNTPHYTRIITSGTYTLEEIAPPTGYYPAQAITFTVDVTSGDVTQVKMRDVPISYISKIDITTGTELPGATLTVKNESGVVVDHWTSTSTPHNFGILTGGVYDYNIPDGTYTLIEDYAPTGFLKAESITFTVEHGAIVGRRVVMEDIPSGYVAISKIDITTSEELPGAQLTITDSVGNVVDSWTSTTTPHLTRITTTGTYTLTEVTAPNGYSVAQSIDFYVDVTSDTSTKVEMYDVPQSLISKTDITTGSELPGAQLEIYDSSNNLVDHWTSTTTPHVFGILQSDNSYDYRLPDGRYTLVEKIAPTGYYKATSIEFEVVNYVIVGKKVVMKDTPVGTVEFSKVDLTTGNELPGATLTITDSSGHTVDSWVSGTKPHYFKFTTSGEYTLTEVFAPTGYEVAESIKFKIDLEHPENTTTSVVMRDKPTPRVEIKKLDLLTGKFVSGARLQIQDSNGKVVDEWTTSDSSHQFSPSAAGTYTLIELKAPYGYLKADPITFTVRFDGRKEDTVVMYDSPVSAAGVIRLTRTSKPAPYIVPRTDSTGEAGSSVKIEPVGNGITSSPRKMIGIGMVILAIVGLGIYFVINKKYVRKYPVPIFVVMGVTAVVAILMIVIAGMSNKVETKPTASDIEIDKSGIEEGVAVEVVDVSEERVDDRDYLIVDYNFSSYDEHSTYDIPATIDKDGKTWAYTGEVVYETQTVTPIAVYVAQQALLIDETMDSNYTLELLNGSHLDMPLYRTATSDTAIVDYSVVKTVEFEEGTTPEDVPNRDTITYYNEILGIDITIDASRIGDIEYLTKEFNDGIIYATFEASAPEVELFIIENYPGEPVAASEVADAPYFENYAQIITEMVGGGIENFAVTGGEWTSDVYEENGVYKRDAVFHYSGFANVLQAMYEGTGEAYGYNAQGMYLTQVSSDDVQNVPRDYLRALYGIKATARYVEVESSN